MSIGAWLRWDGQTEEDIEAQLSLEFTVSKEAGSVGYLCEPWGQPLMRRCIYCESASAETIPKRPLTA